MNVNAIFGLGFFGGAFATIGSLHFLFGDRRQIRIGIFFLLLAVGVVISAVIGGQI